MREKKKHFTQGDRVQHLNGIWRGVVARSIESNGIQRIEVQVGRMTMVFDPKDLQLQAI